MPELPESESWLEIRSAVAADLEAVADSEVESFPDDAWTLEYLAAVVAGQLPTIRLLVVADSGRVVGHAIVSILFEDAELQRIAVLPSDRRRGLARVLLRSAETLSQSEGAERMLLEVRETNAGALALYRSTGFAEIDRRVGYYRDGTNGIVLEKRLDAPTGAVNLEVSDE